MANPVKNDTVDDASCRVQKRVHLHPQSLLFLLFFVSAYVIETLYFVVPYHDKDCPQRYCQVLCANSFTGKIETQPSGNRGIAESGLQMLHVHVFLAAPLSACDMAQAGSDEHQRGITVGEGSDYARTSSDFAVQAFNDVVCPDPSPVFGREVAVPYLHSNHSTTFLV